MGSLYLVGGSIRDMLLGRNIHDLDFAFSGGVEAFVQALPQVRKVGRTVDVWLLRGMEMRPLQGDSLAEDLASRDMTVNALALDECGRLHAHPQALADLQEGVLRPASADALRRDPTRVFRVARLAAELPDFSVHEEALRQMRTLAGSGELVGLPAERVSGEVRKALAAPQPSRFLQVLAWGACLNPWLEELKDADTVSAGPFPWHDNSVLEHTGEVMDRCAGDPLAVWMGLCHDLGKMSTDPALLPHHYGHEDRGDVPARTLAERLRLPVFYRDAGELAATLHMKAGRYAELRPGTRRDLLWRVHAARVHASFWRMVEADSGKALLSRVNVDLEKILAVSLPEDWRNKGEASGHRLRDLQCQALGS